jgi:hypothetical protein
MGYIRAFANPGHPSMLRWEQGAGIGLSAGRFYSLYARIHIRRFEVMATESKHPWKSFQGLFFTAAYISGAMLE